MSIAAALPLGDLINPGQNRLTSVQIVNWGTFDGAHTIRVDRAGTLLTGESGVGKSTIFDAILQLMDARPRMNEAAQTNHGGANEERRTTFSYMRGRLGNTPDGGTTATAFQRPHATWSAVSLTFDNALGQVLAISTLLDLPANGTENSIGRYYLVHNRPLDIAAVEAKARGRFTKGSIEAMLPGVQVFDSHKQFAERFRPALGIGNDKAFGLLRILQSGKGLGGSVNDFFRHHVLDTPKTLVAADEAVEDFSYLSSIRRQLERARKQRDQLADVPGQHRLYREALAGLERNRVLAGEALPVYRQRLALDIHERGHRRLAAEAAGKRVELSRAQDKQAALKQRMDTLSAQYNSRGGAAVATLERELNAARTELHHREATEAAVRADLARAGLSSADLTDAGFDVVGSPTGWAAARAEAARLNTEIVRQLDAAREHSNDAQGQAWALKGRIAELTAEIEAFRTRRSNIGQDSIERRRQICAATGIPEEELPFAAELIEVAPEHSRWRPAAERALRPLATALLVPGKHIPAVTRHISDNHMHGFIRCIDVSDPVGEATPGPRDLVTRLLTPDTPMGRWVRAKITGHYDYPCVEDPDELAGLRKGVSLGGAVKRNSSTTEKDDRLARAGDYILGFDNKDKLADLDAELLELRTEFTDADALAQQRATDQQQLKDRLDAVRRIAADTRGWEDIGADVQRTAVAAAQQRLEDAAGQDTDLEQLRLALDTAGLDHNAATEQLGVIRTDLARLTADLQAADVRLARLRGDGTPADEPGALSGELTQALAGYFARAAEESDAAGPTSAAGPAAAGEPADDDGQAADPPAGPVEISDPAALAEIAGRVERTLLAERGRLETTLLETRNRLIRSFEGYAEKWGSDYGTGIESAAAYEARFEDIVSEGLPQREAEFREYFNNRTYERFSDLIQLLDEERRSISQRLLPLNQILAGVEYHVDSHLEIEITPAVPDAAHRFRTALKNAMPPIGRRQTEAEMDARYLALERIVERLKNPEERRWRAEVLDVRGHLAITCTHRLDSGQRFTNLQASLMSGGEGQRFTAFIMAAALAYQLGIVAQGFSTYGTVMMDEAFVKSSLSFAEASINALHEFGFQLLLAAPEDKVDLSRFLGSVTEILRDDAANQSGFVEHGRSLAYPVDIMLREPAEA